MALFHEMVGNQPDKSGDLRTLRTEVFSSNDALVYFGQPNGLPPQHILFAADSRELVDALENDEQRTETVAMAVLWNLNEAFLAEQGITYTQVKGRDGRARYELELAGIGGKDKLDLMVLAEMLGSVKK